MSDFNLSIDLDPNDIKAELSRDLENLTAKIFRQIGEDAPEEMRGLMTQQGGRSEPGEVPHRQSGTLARSLRGVVDKNSATIEMAEHGFYLDPVFEGEGKGGGYLNRPFVERGLAKSLGKLAI